MSRHHNDRPTIQTANTCLENALRSATTKYSRTDCINHRKAKIKFTEYYSRCISTRAVESELEGILGAVGVGKNVTTPTSI
jgi:hypothetical protein